jgi:hypothetical protein
MNPLNKACVNISENILTNFGQNNTYNNSEILSFIDSWHPPMVFTKDNMLCGPIFKLMQEMSTQYGYKYDIENRCYLKIIFEYLLQLCQNETANG